jgi:hypothetical protein
VSSYGAVGPCGRLRHRWLPPRRPANGTVFLVPAVAGTRKRSSVTLDCGLEAHEVERHARSLKIFPMGAATAPSGVPSPCVVGGCPAAIGAAVETGGVGRDQLALGLAEAEGPSIRTS